MRQWQINICQFTPITKRNNLVSIQLYHISQMGIYCFLSVDTMHPYSLSFWGTCSSSFLPSPSNPWFPRKPPNSYKAVLLISPLISPGVGTFPAKPFRTLPWAMLTTKKRLSTPLWYIGTTQGNEKPSVVSCPMEKTSWKRMKATPREEPGWVMERERGRERMRMRETLQNPDGGFLLT